MNEAEQKAERNVHRTNSSFMHAELTMRNDIANRRLSRLLFLMGVLFPQFPLAKSHNGDVVDVAGVNVPSSNSPKLTDCLFSASNATDCGSVVAGCKWCAEPVYGLCVTETVSERISWMPFFTCDGGTGEV